MRNPPTALIYVASSAADEPFCKELVRHLALLRRTQGVDVWCDQDITPGRERDREIAEVDPIVKTTIGQK